MSTTGDMAIGEALLRALGPEVSMFLNFPERDFLGPCAGPPLLQRTLRGVEA